MNKWVKDMAERVVSSFAIGLLSAWGSDITGLLDIDWGQAASVGGYAALLSFVKALAALGVGKSDSASLVPSV